MFQRLRLASVALGELFSGGAYFTVPAFQRPFDWGPDEALQLLDDVSRAAGIETPDQADPDYFLGTVLLLTEDGDILPGASSGDARSFNYQIIDGQQRLTTLTVLFSILRDLNGRPRESAVRLSKLIELPAASDGMVRSTRSYRIQLNGADRDLLQRYVQRPGGTVLEPDDASFDACIGASKLYAVREALISTLTQLSSDQRDQLAEFLIEKCHVVATLSRDIERAHRVFTVLNERGKPLRRNDIVKVEVLGGLSTDDADYVRGNWEAAEQQLGDEFETFFSHVKAMHGRRRASVVTGLRSLIVEAGGPRAFVDELLIPYARVFGQIQSCRNAPVPIGDELSLHLFYLGRLRGQEWYPAALTALKCYENDPDRALRLIRGVDRLAHVSRILCHGSGRRATRFARVVQAILSGEASDESAEVFAFGREEIRNAKFHLRNLHRRNPPVCKLLLMRINDRISGEVSLLDPKGLSVEHVLPNRPAAGSGWRELFPEHEVREAATQCLGNYTLIPDKLNDRMRNRDFIDKQKQIAGYFGDSPMLAIVADVAAAPIWDLKRVAERELQFLEALGEIIGFDVRDAALDPVKVAAE
ncbi:MAG: DUF262 domain-containing protein [Hyphomicrobiaceae bacterium]